MDANCRLLGKADIVTMYRQKGDLNSEPSVISGVASKPARATNNKSNNISDPSEISTVWIRLKRKNFPLRFGI
jgi:hypothetical protein